jgi:hypothetical protein
MANAGLKRKISDDTIVTDVATLKQERSRRKMNGKSEFDIGHEIGLIKGKTEEIERTVKRIEEKIDAKKTNVLAAVALIVSILTCLAVVAQAIGIFVVK